MQHGASRFQDITDTKAICHNRIGYRREIEPNDTGFKRIVFYILPDMFRAEIGKDKRIPKLLYENGLLIKGDGVNYTCKPLMKLPDIGYKRCYTLILQDDYSYMTADDPKEAISIYNSEVLMKKYSHNNERRLDRAADEIGELLSKW